MHDIDLTRLEDTDDEFDDEFEDEEDEELLDEADEMELAAELLEIEDEEELEEFLGKLFKKAVGGVKRFARSGVGRALGRTLKGVAKVALPVAGKALGNFVVPGLGGVVGGKLGSLATRLFEVQAEGMSDEEVQLEMARRFVRLSASAARHAARAPHTASPTRVAQAAVKAAARRHAPGLVRGNALARTGARVTVGASQSGRWIRRGRSIVLLGL